jgi:hypothetical protein
MVGLNGKKIEKKRQVYQKTAIPLTRFLPLSQSLEAAHKEERLASVSQRELGFGRRGSQRHVIWTWLFMILIFIYMDC